MITLPSPPSNTQTTYSHPASTSTPKLRIQALWSRASSAQRQDCLSSPVVLETLRSHPPQSFGRVWADFLDRRGLSSTPTEARCQQLLNGIHILTSYGTDPIGQAEVQAFLLGTRFRWLNQQLAIALFRPLLLKSRWIEKQTVDITAEPVFQRLLNAYRRGRKSVINLQTWQPEMLLDLPLAVVQRWFQV